MMISKFQKKEETGEIEDLPKEEEGINEELHEKCGKVENTGEIRACVADNFDIGYGNAGSLLSMVSETHMDALSKSMGKSEEGKKDESKGRIYG